jgi:peptide/nickel transport system permease protein
MGRTLRLWIPAGFLILVLAMCFLWPLVYKMPSPTNGNILDAQEPPFSPGHWLGTDQVGVDEFSQIVYGGRVAFEVALATTVFGMVIGSVIGIIAGYSGGMVDAVLSRVLDILIAFPALVLALAIAEGLGPSEFHVILALAVFSIPAFGRVTRGATLVLRDLPFMVAARLAGARRWRIIIRHIVPNIMPGILTFSLLGIGIIIILEGALDFLGYGVPAPTATWGSMIANGQQVMTATPEYVLIPSIFLLITVVGVNMLGDALRERWGVQ